MRFNMPGGRLNGYSVFLHGLLIVFGILVLMLGLENRKLEASQGGERSGTFLAAGDQLPALSVNELDGRESELRFDRARQDTVAMLFTTTCSICEDNLGRWLDLHQRLGGELDFVAIGLDDPQAVRAYAAENSLPFRVVTPNDKVGFAKGYRVKGVPQTILVGPDARVKKIQVGKLNGW